jgi:hypothetical protein
MPSSASNEDAYFSDGMTDEVRNKLASLPQLVVISRNSMTGYKGTQKTPQVIAKELGVHYLLSVCIGIYTGCLMMSSGKLSSSSLWRTSVRWAPDAPLPLPRSVLVWGVPQSCASSARKRNAVDMPGSAAAVEVW